MTEANQHPLKTILALDAATCTGMGLLLLVAAQPIAGFTHMPQPLLFWAGLLLLPIAAFMALTARAARPPAWAVVLTVTGNILWVLASLALPLTGTIAPNAFGWIFLLAQAVIVAGFAWGEWAARRPVQAAI